MPTKAEAAIAPLIAQLQARAAAPYQRVIEFANRGLAPDQANALLGIIRDSQSALDVKTELTVLAASLMQPN